ncbi:MAG: hypothetical protein WAQ24_02505 [Candidatus Saccharimonadales bacterium]
MWRRYGDWKDKRRSTDVPRNLYQSVQLQLRNTVPIASSRWRRNAKVDYLKPQIEAAKKEAEDTQNSSALSGAKAWAWLYALLLQTPQAAIAQQQMDAHPHGYAARGERLYELIDFNDAYVSTILALPDTELPGFAEEAKRLMDWFCKRVGVRSFNDEQYRAIVQGLSREIAVYHAAEAEGFEVYMTNRTSDAMGIDMVITDRQTEKYVNIDCKAPSSYRHRIYELLREGRLSEQEVTAAEALGYIAEMNGHGQEKVEVVVWRIDRETYGEIRSFVFADTTHIKHSLQAILGTYGLPTKGE